MISYAISATLEGKSIQCKIKQVTLVPNFPTDVQRSR